MTGWTRPVVILLVAVGLLAALGAGGVGTAAAVTEDEVEAACADSREALDTYREARASFEDASYQLEEINLELAETAARAERIQGMVDRREADIAELEGEVTNGAVELYMEQVAGTAATVLGAASTEELLTASMFLEGSSGDTQARVNDLTALRSDLIRLHGELEEATAELARAQAAQEEAVARQEQAMTQAAGVYDELDERCRELQSQYEQEQAARRAAEQARRRGRSTQASLPGTICAFGPGRTQFIDSWGYPRPGGRSHKGVDMMAPWNDPVYAVQSGVVDIADHGIGGKHIWLTADSGTGFYYAHLNSFNVADGQRVEKGQVIGYNGNSGNAAGGAPHVHLQIHPGGRGAPAINPYPTMADACF